MEQFILGFWLVIPLLLAGLVMVFILKKELLMFLRYPVDGGRLWHSHPIFGQNKTWLGFIVMSGVSAVVGALVWSNVSLLQTSLDLLFWWQALLGFGLAGFSYSLAELPNSFFKRNQNINPGTLPVKNHALYTWIDLADGVLGAGLVYWLILGATIESVVWGVVIGLVVHWFIHRWMVTIGLKSAT